MQHDSLAGRIVFRNHQRRRLFLKNLISTASLDQLMGGESSNFYLYVERVFDGIHLYECISNSPYYGVLFHTPTQLSIQRLLDQLILTHHSPNEYAIVVIQNFLYGSTLAISWTTEFHLSITLRTLFISLLKIHSSSTSTSFRTNFSYSWRSRIRTVHLRRY